MGTDREGRGGLAGKLGADSVGMTACPLLDKAQQRRGPRELCIWEKPTGPPPFAAVHWPHFGIRLSEFGLLVE
jgi:hypothetical protein